MQKMRRRSRVSVHGGVYLAQHTLAGRSAFTADSYVANKLGGAPRGSPRGPKGLKEQLSGTAIASNTTVDDASVLAPL